MANETWKDIPGYEGLYQASKDGQVRSLKRTTTSGRVLKQHISKSNGYCYVSLSKGNCVKSVRVHRLVYEAFHGVILPARYNKECTIDHIDGVKTNNSVDNLELCSQSENQLRAYRNGLNGKSEVKVIDLTTGKVFPSLTSAAMSVGGKNAGVITRVCNGQRSNYRNHRFAYFTDYVNGIERNHVKKPKRSSEGLWR